MRAFADKRKSSPVKRASSARGGRAHSEQGRKVSLIPFSQRTIGNQAAQRSLQAKADEIDAGSAPAESTHLGHDISRIPSHAGGHIEAQPKLTVGSPGDRYEQEADRVAEQVMRMPAPLPRRHGETEEEEEEGAGPKPLAAQMMPLVQRQSEPEEEEEIAVRTKPVSGERQPVADVAATIGTLRANGQPLSLATRAFFEPRFGHDFGGVRVHADPQAARAARALSARAFTVGGDVVFAGGEYAPETEAGRRLLAHELTHVLQQGAALRLDPPPLRHLLPRPFLATEVPRIQRQETGAAESGAVTTFTPEEVLEFEWKANEEEAITIVARMIGVLGTDDVKILTMIEIANILAENGAPGLRRWAHDRLRLLGQREKASVPRGAPAAPSTLGTTAGVPASYGIGQLLTREHVERLLKLHASRDDVRQLLETLGLKRADLNGMLQRIETVTRWYERTMAPKKAKPIPGMDPGRFEALIAARDLDTIVKEFGGLFQEQTGIPAAEIRYLVTTRLLCEFLSSHAKDFGKLAKEVQRRVHRSADALSYLILQFGENVPPDRPEIREAVDAVVAKRRKAIRREHEEARKRILKVLPSASRRKVARLLSHGPSPASTPVELTAPEREALSKLSTLSLEEKAAVDAVGAKAVLKEIARDSLKLLPPDAVDEARSELDALTRGLSGRLRLSDYIYYLRSPGRLGEIKASWYTRAAMADPRAWRALYEHINILDRITSTHRHLANFQRAKRVVQPIEGELNALPLIERARLLGQLCRLNHLGPAYLERFLKSPPEDIDDLEARLGALNENQRRAVNSWLRHFAAHEAAFRRAYGETAGPEKG